MSCESCMPNYDLGTVYRSISLDLRVDYVGVGRLEISDICDD